MAKRPTRGTARKVKDRWKSKQWFTIHSPDMLNRTAIAETMAVEPDQLMGRVATVTLQDLTGDFSKMHIKLHFKIHEVDGLNAYTLFTGHDLTSDYIRRQTRRKRSKLDGVFDVTTRDSLRIRIKPMAVTESRIQVSQQKALRDVMREVIEEAAQSRTMDAMVGDIIHGNLAKAIQRKCKIVYPLKRVEIRKSEVLSSLSLAAEKAAERRKEIEEEEAKKEEGSREEFFNTVTSIQGIGASKAELLWEGGLTSVEAILKADVEKITEVDGIGKAFAQKLVDGLKKMGDKSEVAPEEMDSE